VCLIRANDQHRLTSLLTKDPSTGADFDQRLGEIFNDFRGVLHDQNSNDVVLGGRLSITEIIHYDEIADPRMAMAANLYACLAAEHQRR
tara:strand:- start:440 stop:706 length:267 start_codon:yes stop_codon:yes gene_type:complete